MGKSFHDSAGSRNYAFASAAVDVSDKKKLRPRALHGTHSGSPAMLPVDVRTLAL
ncbi:MAG: hypothetical protein ACJARS_002047, partial [bacterium]